MINTSSGGPNASSGRVSTAAGREVPHSRPTFFPGDVMARISKAAKKALELRSNLWPDLDPTLLWNRHEMDGYTSVPRTMPIVTDIIDDLTKGKPAGRTYFELWCRAYDEMYVSLGSASTLATHSGYSGPRAVRMWSERIESLVKLGFILVEEGSAGKLAHALVLNPHLVIKRLYANKAAGISKAKYNALMERATEIGSEDFKPPKPPKAESASPGR